MTEPQNSDDEKQRDEILRRMLRTPPKPHKEKDAEPKPSARRLGVDSSHEGSNRVKHSRDAE